MLPVRQVARACSNGPKSPASWKPARLNMVVYHRGRTQWAASPSWPLPMSAPLNASAAIGSCGNINVVVVHADVRQCQWQTDCENRRWCQQDVLPGTLKLQVQPK